jgi:hypothetical protein
LIDDIVKFFSELAIFHLKVSFQKRTQLAFIDQKIQKWFGREFQVVLDKVFNSFEQTTEFFFALMEFEVFFVFIDWVIVSVILENLSVVLKFLLEFQFEQTVFLIALHYYLVFL